MNFELDETQTLIRNSVARFLNDAYAFPERQQIVATESGYLEEHWQQFAELGLLAASVPEELGGLGGGTEAAAIIAEQLGRHLMVSPYVPNVLALSLLAEAGNENQHALLAEATAGQHKFALAALEPEARYRLADVQCHAEHIGSDYRLVGHKTAVHFGSVADTLIVTARTQATRYDHHGITLFLVQASQAGVDVQPFRTHDGGTSAEVRLDGVVVANEAVVGLPGNGLAALEQAVDIANTVMCAEAVGAMWASYEQTLDYLKVRSQFGAILGSMQALQHRMVNVYMQCELAQSMLYSALAGLQEQDSVARAQAVSGAKYQIMQAAQTVTREGIQLHGGMGMMRELPIGHYLKRVTMINTTYGDAEFHLERAAAA